MKLILDKKLSLIFAITIFSIGFFLRFYRLSEIPKGLYTDETAIGYNAFSILQTGKDEHGKPYPLYFESFGDYKLPLYIYSVAISEKFFGIDTFAVRFPSAFFGSLTVVAIFFLIYELSKNMNLSLFSTLFLAVNPWHSFFSRVGYEVNMATAFLVFGTFFFVVGIKRRNNTLFFFLAVLSFIFSLYTYNVTRLSAPLLLIMLAIFYRKNLSHLSVIKRISLLGLCVLGILPFLITFKSGSGFSSNTDVLLIGGETKANILLTRSYFAGFPSIFSKLFFNYWVLLFWQYIKNLVSFFSTDFFFLSGGDHPVNSIGNFGMFHLFEFPLIVLGIYEGLRKKQRFLYPFFFWMLIVWTVGSIIKFTPHATRSYVIIIPLVIFSAYGFFTLLQWVTKQKNYAVKKFAFGVCIMVIGYSYLFYFISYFIRFPVEQANAFRSEDQNLMTYLKNTESNYSAIYLDKQADISYTSLLFYQQYSPVLFQKEAIYEKDGALLRPKAIGKYQYRDIDWEKDLKKRNILIITNKNDKIPGTFKPSTTFFYPTRPVVLYYNSQIGQFPTTDTAYEIFTL